ncbi:MAG: hypothetical protein IJ305_02195, partial [Oscillospiraceae bacterium]|nr:hypothetical protein [Oscillospiraceae bacterium]
MKEQLEKIRQLAEAELAECNAADALEALRVKYLGKKGELTAILKQMGGLSAEERPIIGQLANEVRKSIEDKLAESSYHSYFRWRLVVRTSQLNVNALL